MALLSEDPLPRDRTAGRPTCVILTTDTKHHRYLANRVAKRAETIVVFETATLSFRRRYWKWARSHPSPWALIENPYLRLGHKKFDALQDQFEDRFFDASVPYELEVSAVRSFETANEPACVGLVQDVAPDLVVSFGTGILRKAILEVPATKINVHRGILPWYRGLDSDLWAFYFEDFARVGTTLHTLEPRLDTGAIVGEKRLRLERGMEPHHIRYHTTVLAAEIVESVLANIEGRREVTGKRQDVSRGRYFPPIPPLKRALAMRRFRRFVSSVSQGHAASSAT